MSGKKKGSAAQKAIAAVCCILICVGLFFGGKAVYDHFAVDDTPPPGPIVDPVDPTTPDDPKIDKLNAPQNLTYDTETDIISWDPVENAQGYLLTINDVQQKTDETEHHVDLAEEQAYKITVKALGDKIKYNDSDLVACMGYKQNQEYVAYKKIENNIKEMFAELNYAGTTVDFKEILLVDYVDNIFEITVKSALANNPHEGYIIFKINTSPYYQATELNLKEVAKASDYLVEASQNFRNVGGEPLCGVEEISVKYPIYDRLINDPSLIGTLKEYIDNGFIVSKVFSETRASTGVDSFSVKSLVKLKKGNITKFLLVENEIQQKYHNAWGIEGYIKAYSEGTAEEVVINELSVREFSDFTVLWSKTVERFKDYTEIPQAAD